MKYFRKLLKKDMRGNIKLFIACFALVLLGYYFGHKQKQSEISNVKLEFESQIKFKNDIIIEQMEIISKIRSQRDSLISKSQDLSLNLLETVELIDKLSKSKPNQETKKEAEKWIEAYNLFLQQ